jgi:hypothetical protein
LSPRKSLLLVIGEHLVGCTQLVSRYPLNSDVWRLTLRTLDANGALPPFVRRLEVFERRQVRLRFLYYETEMVILFRTVVSRNIPLHLELAVWFRASLFVVHALWGVLVDVQVRPEWGEDMVR